MGGYGFYVWLSFGVTFLCMLGVVIQSRMEAKALLDEVKRNEKRQAKIKQAMEINQ
jgi:heme exporter protein D